jgi:hypothetical protein
MQIYFCQHIFAFNAVFFPSLMEITEFYCIHFVLNVVLDVIKYKVV